MRVRFRLPFSRPVVVGGEAPLLSCIGLSPPELVWLVCLIGFRDRVGFAGVFDIKRPKIVFRRGFGEHPEGVRRGSEGLLAARPENGRWRPVFWDPLGAVLGSFLGPSWRLGRRLGPTLVVLVPLKIDAKIDQFLNASWDRIFEGFWWILERKMEPSWHPKTIKN